MQSTGSNLNAGSTSSDAAVYTSTGGNFDGTSVFTPTDGTTTSALVSVGDWASIYPTGNTTTPYIAQVTAVGAGANGTITLSTTNKFGTAPTSNSGSRNCKTGGAWADLGMTASGVALNTGTVAQSTCVNIKAGTFANTSTTRTLTLAGATTTPLWWRGYKTTIGDQDTNNVAVAGTDIPSITFTTGQFSIAGTHQVFSNLDISGATTTANGQVTNTSGGTNLLFYRCRLTNTAANVQSRAFTQLGVNVNFVACALRSNAAATIVRLLNTPSNYDGCTFTGGLIGLDTNNNATMLRHCAFDSQASDAILLPTAPAYIFNCAFYNPGGNGINISTLGANTSILIDSCYFENVAVAAKAAINNTSGTNTNLVRAVANSYFNCTANTSGLGDSPLIFDVGTLAAAGFANPGSQNFALNGPAQKLGFPGLFENVSAYQGYLSNGAVQPSGTLINQGEY